MRTWMGLALMVACIVSMGGTASAQLASDDFTYTAGNLNGQSGGSGFSAAWSASSEFTTTGTAVSCTNCFSSANRSLSPNSAMANDGDSAYMSVRVTATGTVPTFELVFPTPVSGSHTVMGFDSSGFKQNSGSRAGAVVPGTEYLLVQKITRNDAGNDTAVLWVNPSSEADTPLMTQSTDFLSPGDTGYSQLYLSVFGSGSVQIDDVRYGSSFSAVAPAGTTAAAIPTLSEWGLITLFGALAGTMFVSQRRRRAAAG